MLSGDDIAQRTDTIMRSIIKKDAHNRMLTGRALHDVYRHFAHADAFHVLVVEEERTVSAASADPQPTPPSQQQQRSDQSGACKRHYRVKVLEAPEVTNALNGPKRSSKGKAAPPAGERGKGKEQEEEEERQEIDGRVVSRRQRRQFTFGDYCQYHLPANQKLFRVVCRIRETLLTDLFHCVLRATRGPDAQDTRSSDTDDMDIALQVAPSAHRCFQPLMTRYYEHTGRNADAWLARTRQELERWLMHENQLPVRRFMLAVWVKAKAMAGHSHGASPSQRRQLSCAIFQDAYNEVRGTVDIDGRLHVSCPLDADADADTDSFESNDRCSSDSASIYGPDREIPCMESANTVAPPLTRQDDVSATTEHAGQPVVPAAIVHTTAATPSRLTTLSLPLAPATSSRAIIPGKRPTHGPDKLPGEQETCAPPTAKRRRCTERPRGATGDRRAGEACDADSTCLDGVLPVAAIATVAGTPEQQCDCAAAATAAATTLLLTAETIRAETLSASATTHAHCLSRLTMNILAEHYRFMSNIIEMHKTILPCALSADNISSSSTTNTNNMAASPPTTAAGAAGTLDRPQSAPSSSSSSFCSFP